MFAEPDLADVIPLPKMIDALNEEE